MEISYNQLKVKDIINIYDGKKLGRVVDVCFDSLSGGVLGIVVPGEKKILRRTDDLFIPIENIKKIGEDVILVKLSFDSETNNNYNLSGERKTIKNHNVYARYRKVVEKEK